MMTDWFSSHFLMYSYPFKKLDFPLPCPITFTSDPFMVESQEAKEKAKATCKKS